MPATASRVTVATVVYNGAADIARTLESILSQDYPNVELIVIDGGSCDGTRSIVQRYGDRVAKFISEPDRGIYDAMNKAIELASGEFVLFMNCGDTFAGPSSLSTAARALVPGTPQVVFGAWQRKDASGRLTLCRPSPAGGLFNHQSVLYSRALHNRFGSYVSARGFTTADYLFFMTLLASDSVTWRCIDETIAVIDVGGISAGLQTFSQKHAINYLFGRSSRLKLVLVLALHPVYFALKRVLRRLG